jgi:predicted acetyltransferase
VLTVKKKFTVNLAGIHPSSPSQIYGKLGWEKIFFYRQRVFQIFGFGTPGSGPKIPKPGKRADGKKKFYRKFGWESSVFTQPNLR